MEIRPLQLRDIFKHKDLKIYAAQSNYTGNYVASKQQLKIHKETRNNMSKERILYTHANRTRAGNNSPL